MTDYVQYGCGLSAPEGWTNFDASLRLRLENLPGVRAIVGGKALFPSNVRYGDILESLPIAANSVSGLYASHILEHLYRSDIKRALANSFKILKPGGIFRLIVPDLAWRTDQYIATRGGPKAADIFQDGLMLRPRSTVKGLEGRLRAVFGLSLHQWMYDEALMVDLLAAAGFTAIRRCEFGDCEDPAFAEVESEGRFFEGEFKELAIEARKPLSQ